jgi:hypothetical protein
MTFTDATQQVKVPGAVTGDVFGPRSSAWKDEVASAPGAGVREEKMSVETDWAIAAEDAGVDPRLVVLYPLSSTSDYDAQHFPPGRSPREWQEGFAFTDSDRGALEQLDDRHVIVIDADIDEPRRLLVLRHEAEHVRQYESSSAAGEFAHQLAIALREGEGWLYFAMPHERDADAAATTLRHAREIESSHDELEGKNRMLFDAPWSSPDLGTLPVRLLAFSLFRPDDFDVACTASQYWPHVDPDELIEEMIPGGAEARQSLRTALKGAIEQIADHGITEQEWQPMSRSAKNVVFDRLRQQVVEREQEIVEELEARLTGDAAAASDG